MTESIHVGAAVLHTHDDAGCATARAGLTLRLVLVFVASVKKVRVTWLVGRVYWHLRNARLFQIKYSPNILGR